MKIAEGSGSHVTEGNDSHIHIGSEVIVGVRRDVSSYMLWQPHNEEFVGKRCKVERVYTGAVTGLRHFDVDIMGPRTSDSKGRGFLCRDAVMVRLRNGGLTAAGDAIEALARRLTLEPHESKWLHDIGVLQNYVLVTKRFNDVHDLYCGAAALSGIPGGVAVARDPPGAFIVGWPLCALCGVQAVSEVTASARLCADCATTVVDSPRTVSERPEDRSGTQHIEALRCWLRKPL